MQIWCLNIGTWHFEKKKKNQINFIIITLLRIDEGWSYSLNHFV